MYTLFYISLFNCVMTLQKSNFQFPWILAHRNKCIALEYGYDVHGAKTQILCNGFVDLVHRKYNVSYSRKNNIIYFVNTPH